MEDDLNPILKRLKHVANELNNSQMTDLLNKIADYDEETLNHSVRVAALSAEIGYKMHIEETEIHLAVKASLLHDIGKLLIPIEIINKPDRLTADEYRIVKTHPMLGAEYLKSRIPEEERLIEIVKSHHENFDGTGYPSEITGDKIDQLAKIIRIADTYDAMHNDRPYKSGVSSNKIYELFLHDLGHCYDPEIVNIL